MSFVVTENLQKRTKTSIDMKVRGEERDREKGREPGL